MSSMKKTKEGVNLKKCLRLKNTGSIFVIAGLLTILVIASYTYILQSSYTKTTLETEITRDTASADAVHKLVNGKIGKEDFDQIKDQSDEKKQLYKDISSYFNEIRTLNSTRYIYTATKNEEGKLVYVVDGLNPDADDVRHPGDYIEEEMVPYIDRAISGENVYSHDIIDTTWGPIFTACYPVSANHDGTGEIIGAFCIEMDVLMAEDNDLNAELATIMLEDAGMTVTRASDGKEVVNLFKNHPRGTYDLILMDIMMPNMDGHQAAKAIRALGIERSDAVTIPIIALSANAFIDDIQESLDLGMNAHISKPINMEELIDTITKYKRSIPQSNRSV